MNKTLSVTIAFLLGITLGWYFSPTEGNANKREYRNPPIDTQVSTGE